MIAGGRSGRWWVLCGLAALMACAPSMRRGAVRRYADAPFVEPVEAPPDQADADDGQSHGGPRRRAPVFGEMPRKQPEVPAGLARPIPGPSSAMDQIIAGATLQPEYPGFQEHHLFPRQGDLRRQFVLLGIDVDAWTILVDPERHKRAHGERGKFGAGGRWNQEWADWFRSPTDHSFPTAFEQARRMIGSYKLAPYGLLAPVRLWPYDRA